MTLSFQITDCFAVPCIEKTGELFVAINTEYHASMYACHRRINKNEYIVGWYATTATDGALVVDNTSLINEFYSGECVNPIHLVVDTTLSGDKVGIRGFVSQPLVVDGKPFANIFKEIKVHLQMTEAEATCVHLMITGQNAQQAWQSSQVLANLQPQREKLHNALEKMLGVLDTLQEYVDGVVGGSEAPITSVGMSLADTVAMLSAVKADDLNTLFEEKKQDLLMVSYLTSLLQTQLKISEKLNSVM